jgi:multiple sugar transport system substrate-binding protein
VGNVRTVRVQALLSCVLALIVAVGCSTSDSTTRLTFSGSALGAEGDVVSRQLARFEAQHPGVEVVLQVTPDAADQRHQLYVQWLNAHAPEPDVLQLDVIWTAEFAGAGWIRPIEPTAGDREDFVSAAWEAARWRDSLFALPWFVDVGLLYWRTDLLSAPPASIGELRDAAIRASSSGPVRFGLVWQGARYEGLITVFLEHLTAFGARILDDDGRVIVDAPAAVRALTFMRDELGSGGFVPASTLTWQEEQTRFAFQNGSAVFMRNWPYAWTLLQDRSQSAVAGRFAVAPFPAGDDGRPAAALGGAELAINRWSRSPELAEALARFLTAPAQMLERARVVAQFPARRSLYDDPALAEALPIPLTQVRAAIDAAVARPVTPVYTELSEILQVEVHRALSGQATPETALHRAAADMRTLLARTGLAGEGSQP